MREEQDISCSCGPVRSDDRKLELGVQDEQSWLLGGNRQGRGMRSDTREPLASDRGGCSLRSLLLRHKGSCLVAGWQKQPERIIVSSSMEVISKREKRTLRSISEMTHMMEQ